MVRIYTIESFENPVNLFVLKIVIIADDNKEILKMLLELGGDFIDLHKKINNKVGTPILAFAGTPGFSIPQCIEILLKYGASIKDRDCLGRTCLHLVINVYIGCLHLGVRDLLVLLINAGADVYARDNKGKTVSWAAYSLFSCLDSYG